MGACQSRSASAAVVAEVTKNLDGRSARSGSISGSQASESTVTISNTNQRNLPTTSIQEDEIEDDLSNSGSLDDSEMEAVEPLQYESRPRAESTPIRNQRIDKHDSVKQDPPEGGLVLSPARDSPKRNRMERSSGIKHDGKIMEGGELGRSATKKEPSISEEANESRRKLFPTSPSRSRKNQNKSPTLAEPSSTKPSISSSIDEGSSSGEKLSKRSSKSRKAQQVGFSPIRTTIPEEEDPEMPSDEEDFCDDLVRNTPRDEPGRLVPVKLKTHPTTSVASVVVAGNGEGPPMMNLDDKNSVQMHTLSEFQRLKLQVKLQKHQEMKERRVHKVEDRLQDAESYKKLWLEYQKTEQDLAKRDQETHMKPRGPGRRSNSFDLSNSGSWFFDFSSPEAAFDALTDNPDDNGSQASLSLLSEQSLDAQKRYYADKRRRRKEKKKQGKHEKRQKRREVEDPSKNPIKVPMQPPGHRLEGATTPDGLARLNMAKSTASGATRDYGPVRDNITTPLDVEVSFQNRVVGPTDDAGSYISDLGDESWGGGVMGGSHAGNSYSNQQHYPHSSMSGNNDYGVKRRIRRYSGYSQGDHKAMQAKLQSLERSLALMKQEKGDEKRALSCPKPEEPEVPTTASPIDAAADSTGNQVKDGLRSSLDSAISAIDLEKVGNRRNSVTNDIKTERELAKQIHEAILAANTPTRKTRKSSSRKPSNSKAKRSSSCGDLDKANKSLSADVLHPSLPSDHIGVSPSLHPTVKIDCKATIARSQKDIESNSTLNESPLPVQDSDSSRREDLDPGFVRASKDSELSVATSTECSIVETPTKQHLVHSPAQLPVSRADDFEQNASSPPAIESCLPETSAELFPSVISPIPKQDMAMNHEVVPLTPPAEDVSNDSDSSSAATGPLTATAPRRSKHSIDANQKEHDSPHIRESSSDNCSVYTEEKKDDPDTAGPSSDLDEISRTSSVHDSVIASMSKDQFLRMSYGNPVADLVAFRQETGCEENDKISLDKVPVDLPQARTPTKPSYDPSKFWSEQLDEILLKNIFPQGTNVINDTPPPAAVSVTPDTTPASGKRSPGNMSEFIESNNSDYFGVTSD